MFKDPIKIADIVSVIKFAFVWPIAFLMRRLKKNVWLFSERENEACDNSYWLYKYIRERNLHPNSYYVIKQNSKHSIKILELGNLVPFGSIKHYLIYLISRLHVSSHVDAGSPNSRITNFLERNHLLKNKRAFIQHGVTKDKISFGYYSVSRADYFLCAARPEFDFCVKEFGYPEGAVHLLGFPRFDQLKKCTLKTDILIIPTWRSYLASVDNNSDFRKSLYFTKYQELLNEEKIISILEKHNLKLVFASHPEMNRFSKCFESVHPRVSIVEFGNDEPSVLLNRAALLITDYSSIAFDAAYIDIPIIYYHFDYDKYRLTQHPEGFFSYEEDGFGPIVNEIDALIESIRNSLIGGNESSNKYIFRRQRFFSIKDNNNCQRVFNSLFQTFTNEK